MIWDLSDWRQKWASYFGEFSVDRMNRKMLQILEKSFIQILDFMIIEPFLSLLSFNVNNFLNLFFKHVRYPHSPQKEKLTSHDILRNENL